ncbi:MAG: hypothetical protein KKA79_08560 [Nanoarchaeota archaeon]|nr:hypothetical protein [Nanoarchaeota archaeon]
MKVYKKFKGMSKKAKASLIGTTVYAATLALPVYAAVEQELKQPMHPISLEHITTSEQAVNLYKEKLVEYTSDKFLEEQELKNLYDLNLKKKELFTQKKYDFELQYSKGIDVEYIVEQIDAYDEKLTTSSRVPVFKGVKERLENDILSFYHGILGNDEKLKVVYSADTEVYTKLTPVLKEIISDTDKIMKEYYNDNKLELLLEMDSYRLNDVLTLYGLMGRRDKFVMAQEDPIIKKIKDLYQQKDSILNSDQNVALKNKINSLEEMLDNVARVLRHFSEYLDHKSDVDDFEKKYGNHNKDITHSLVVSYQFERKGLQPSKRDRFDALEIQEKKFKKENIEVIFNLENYFSSQGLEAKIAEIGNPAAKRIPWWLGTWIIGFLGPIARNIAIKAYMRGGKMKDGCEYFFSGACGAANGLVGAFLIDGLHPLIFPARMLSPLIIQPAFKLLKIDPCRKISEEL